MDNTDRLIKALPEWYRSGLRTFTTGSAITRKSTVPTPQLQAIYSIELLS